MKLAAAAAVAAAHLAAEEHVARLDPVRTTISFTLGATLHSPHGTFKLKRGEVRFDPAAGKASGELVIDVVSGESGNGMRDRRMHKEILESGRYPEAVFTVDGVSGSYAPEGESQLELHGVFQIHGSSHEMTLPLRVRTEGGTLTASARFTIPYVEWGIKNPSNFFLRTSDKVEMSVEASGQLDAEGSGPSR